MLNDFFILEVIERILILASFFAGIFWPVSFLSLHMDKKTKKIPLYWWLQSIIFFLTCMVVIPLMIHSLLMDMPNYFWCIVGNLTLLAVIFLALLSLIIWIIYVMMKRNKRKNSDQTN